MKFIAKVAAVGATAAITATGLVSATGTSASATTPTYSCTVTDGTNSSAPFDVPLNLNIPTVTQGSTIPAGTPLGGSADIANMLGLVGTDPVITVLGSGLLTLPSLTATPSAFPVSIAGQTLPITLSPQTFTPAQIQQAFNASTLPLAGQFTQALPVTLPAGTYDLALPSAFQLVLSSASTALGQVDCTSTTPQTAHLTVVSASSSTPAPATLSVSAPKKVKAGKVVKVKVTTTATGTAVAKIKGKKVAKATISGGKATLKVKKGLKKGVNKIVVKVGSLSKTVKVKVS